MVHPQPAGVPQTRADQPGQRRVALAGQPLRVPGRLVPVLAALVELVRRRTHAHPRDQHVLPGPGVRATWVAADREIPDDPGAHARRTGRLLGGGQLGVGQPLQPGVKPGLAGQPGPRRSHLGRLGDAQPRRPGPPVRSVLLGQRAPQRPVGQRLPGTGLVRIELALPGGGQRLPVNDLQGGPLGPPHLVPVEQFAGSVAGAQRGGQRVDAHPVARGQRAVLRDVLDPQVQRAGETPGHRQVRGRAQRGQRLDRVQRVDQHEVGAQVGSAPGGQVSQVAQVAVAPGLPGPHRVQLDGEAPRASIRGGGQRWFWTTLLDAMCRAGAS